jgi:hypothetical protein
MRMELTSVGMHQPLSRQAPKDFLVPIISRGSPQPAKAANEGGDGWPLPPGPERLQCVDEPGQQTGDGLDGVSSVVIE